MQFPATLVSGGRKAPPLFSAFHQRPRTILHMWNTQGPHNTNTHSDSSYPNIFFRVTNFVNFSKYSHIEKYRTQYQGIGGSPIGSLMTIHTNIPAIPITLLDMALWNVIRLLYVYAYISLSSLHDKTFSYTFATTEVHIIWIYAKNKHSWKLGRKAHPSFLPFCERPGSCCPCGILMVPILQIHTQISPIWISSLGYQLYQLFKILTYREVQSTGSWCRWKPCRQPYHNIY